MFIESAPDHFLRQNKLEKELAITSLEYFVIRLKIHVLRRSPLSQEYHVPYYYKTQVLFFVSSLFFFFNEISLSLPHFSDEMSL